MDKYKVGDTITAKFTPAFQDEVTVTGIIREFKGCMACCDEINTGKPFFCYFEEIIEV